MKLKNRKIAGFILYDIYVMLKNLFIYKYTFEKKLLT